MFDFYVRFQKTVYREEKWGGFTIGTMGNCDTTKLFVQNARRHGNTTHLFV